MFDTESRTNFVPEFLTAAVMNPCIYFCWNQPERHGRKERIRKRLALIVILCRMIHIGRSFLNRIMALQRMHKFAAGKHLDGHLAIRHIGDSIGKSLCCGTKAREILGPRRNHIELFVPHGNCRCCHGTCCCCSTCDCTSFEKLSTFHNE